MPSPGRGCAAAWDARAWAENRPDKVIPRSGDELRQRWLAELAGLGYRDRDKPIQLALPMAGALDRDAAVAEVVTRLGAARSAWNAADVRGQVEQLLARTGIVADAAVRIELAEDLTARAVELCVPLHESATPEHIRVLTSRHVLDVEADLVARLAARRGPAGSSAESSVAPAAVEGLDAGQRAAVAALAGDAGLVVVEGAAGAGKTTAARRARDQLDRQRRATGRGDTDVEGGAGRHRRGGCAGRVGGVAGLAARLALGRRPAPGPAYSRAMWIRSPARSTAARARKPGFARAICCSWMRPGCWIRTPPAPC